MEEILQSRNSRKFELSVMFIIISDVLIATDGENKTNDKYKYIKYGR